MCSFEALGPRTERGERMCLRHCLARIRLSARLGRRPTKIPVPLVPEERGIADKSGDRDIGTLQEAIRAGHANEWLIARELREKSDALRNHAGADRRRPE